MGNEKKRICILALFSISKIFALLDRSGEPPVYLSTPDH